MDFAMSDEQRMLRDSARRFFTDRSANSASWSSYADLGWIALAAPEDAGGLGGDIEDILIIVEEMGRALTSEPFIGSALLAMRLIDRIGSGEGRIALLSSMVEGTIMAAPALYEPGRRYALTPTVRATGGPDGYLLAGAKALVPGGSSADRLLVTAMLDDGEIGLFAIDPALPCVTLSSYLTIDGSPVADVAFQETPLSADGLIGRIHIDQIERFIDEARLALCADALGGLERAIEMTSEYLATRTQFGTPLAHFQALQHTLVEMFIEIDSMRSSLYQAIAAFHDGDDATRQRAVSSCWVKTFDAAKTVAGMAVHLHGGIGMTTEYKVGNYLRRMIVSERSFGDVEYHIGRYMKLAECDLKCE